MSDISPDQCPEPFWHKTHRYCPVCTWIEPTPEAALAWVSAEGPADEYAANIVLEGLRARDQLAALLARAERAEANEKVIVLAAQQIAASHGELLNVVSMARLVVIAFDAAREAMGKPPIAFEGIVLGEAIDAAIAAAEALGKP